MIQVGRTSLTALERFTANRSCPGRAAPADSRSSLLVPPQRGL